MNQLEQRITKLEKSLKWYRIFFTLTIAGTFSFLLMGANEKGNAPEVIQAKLFEVVDNSGKVIATMGAEKGNGSVNTFTPSGQRLTSLFTTTGGAGAIATYDADGDLNFKVTNTTGGGGYLALYNSESKAVYENGVTNNNSGYMSINDRFGDQLAYLTYTEKGGGYLSLSHNRQELIRFSTTEAGGRIGVYNKRNERVVYAGAQESLDGNVTVSNATGTITGALPK